MAKHFTLDITDTQLAYTRNQAGIDSEAALDGIYVIRTPLPANEMDASSRPSCCVSPRAASIRTSSAAAIVWSRSLVAC